MQQAGAEPKPTAQPTPQEAEKKSPSAATLPAAVSAQEAARRLKLFGDAILPEVEKIAADPKLKGIVPQYFGMGLDGDYYILPTQNPAQVLEAIKRIRELPPDMIPRINDRLKGAKLDPKFTIALPPPVIKPSDDPNLASNNPATVAQALRTYNGMLERAPEDVRTRLAPALASHMHQLVDLAGERSKDQAEVRVLAVTLLGRIGSPHADGAYEQIKALAASAPAGSPLHAACASALKSLQAPEKEKDASKAEQPPKPSEKKR